MNWNYAMYFLHLVRPHAYVEINAINFDKGEYECQMFIKDAEGKLFICTDTGIKWVTCRIK